MERVARKRRITWWATLTAAAVLGASLGVTLF
jgi:hypothetical protein